MQEKEIEFEPGLKRCVEESRAAFERCLIEYAKAYFYELPERDISYSEAIALLQGLFPDINAAWARRMLDKAYAGSPALLVIGPKENRRKIKIGYRVRD